MFRWLATLLYLSQLVASATAGDFPSAAQVEVDARAAVTHGRVTRVEIDGGWKLEREGGYTYAYLANQAIIADKQSPDDQYIIKEIYRSQQIYKKCNRTVNRISAVLVKYFGTCFLPASKWEAHR